MRGLGGRGGLHSIRNQCKPDSESSAEDQRKIEEKIGKKIDRIKNSRQAHHENRLRLHSTNSADTPIPEWDRHRLADGGIFSAPMSAITVPQSVCGAKHQPPFLSHYLPRAYLDPAKCRPRHQPRQCPSMSPRRPTSPRVWIGRTGTAPHVVATTPFDRRLIFDASEPRLCPNELERLSAALLALPFPLRLLPDPSVLPRGPTTVLRIVLATPVTLSPRRSTPLSKRTDGLQGHHGLVLYCCTTVVSMEAWRWA
ncbi:hypothetical protein FB45DRAFT_861251 [Roridomyces roridus]|uniref:Uncharacterized protein n=1 Tax=Roridomyces roridus TaxID=1738132 RepID=A0AAD7CA32_9AGAR|nr:hypothetical protein FB45DRAFT_861251 [Roridomyces roridus]